MKRTSLLVVVCLLMVLFTLFSHTDGAGNNGRNVSGSPLDQGDTKTCANLGCHSTNALNSGPGQINILAPVKYESGKRYQISVDVKDTSSFVTGYGFQLIALDDAGQETAGSLIPKSGQLLQTIGGERYIEHGRVDEAGLFTFEWISPSTSKGNITFYAAGAAVDGEGDRQNDLIYSTSYTTEPLIFDTLIARISTTVQEQCLPAKVQVSSRSIGDIDSMHWDFGANATPALSTANGPFVINYDSAGTKTIRLIVFDGSKRDTAFKSFTLFDKPIVSLPASDTLCEASCSEIVPHVEGGVTPYQFQWSNGSTTKNQTICDTGWYHLTVQDAQGCVAKDSTEIDQVEGQLQVCMENELFETTCDSMVVVFNASCSTIPEGVQAEWIFLLDDEQIEVDDVSNIRLVLTEQKGYEFAYLLKDSLECYEPSFGKQVFGFFFEDSIEAPILINFVDSICPNTPQLKFAVNPVPNATGYEWELPAGCVITSKPDSAVIRVNWGTASGLVRVRSLKPCAKSEWVESEVTLFPTANISSSADASVCIGEGVQLSAMGLSDPNGYEWFPKSSLSNGFVPNPVATPSEKTCYTVVGESEKGCVGEDVTCVDVRPNPTLTIIGKNDLCTGSSLALSANGASEYKWSPAIDISNTNIPNPIVFPKTDICYTIVGTSNGCKDEAEFCIEVHGLPSVFAFTNDDNEICRNDSVTLQAGGAATYTWSPGIEQPSPPGDVFKVSPLINTTYTVVGRDMNGCIDDATLRINVLPVPNVTASNDTAIFEGDTAKLKAFGAVVYQWSPTETLSDPNASSPIAIPSITTTYTVEGWDLNGCRDEENVRVRVLEPLSVNPQSIGHAELFPNPASSYIKLTWSNLNTSLAIFQLYTLQGVLVKSKKVYASESIDISTLPSGFYTWTLNNAVKGKLVVY